MHDKTWVGCEGEDKTMVGVGPGLDDAAMVTFPARRRWDSSMDAAWENRSEEPSALKCSTEQRPGTLLRQTVAGAGGANTHLFASWRISGTSTSSP